MKLAKVLCAYLMHDINVIVDKHLVTVTKGLTSSIKVRARFDIYDTNAKESKC